MAFQFYCPNGHLLQGHEMQQGQQCTCPFCYTVFFIPYAQSAPMMSPSAPDFSGIAAPTAIEVPEAERSGEQEVNVFPASDESGETEFGEHVDMEPEEDPNRIIHIICPEGHELPTPMSMVGQDAMCPYCSSLFQLRYEDSKEHKEEKRAERERRETIFGKKAMNFAIVCAVVIVLAIVGMIVFSSV